MIFCPKNLVGNSKFYDDVLDILTRAGLPSPLFSAPNSRSIIDERYNEMKKDYFKKGTVLEKPYLLSSLNPFGIAVTVPNVGHDLPIWYTPCDESNGEETIICPECDDTENCTFTDERLKGKRIMIIGLDPKRKKQGPGWITLSTPWGLHNRDYREGKRAINGGLSQPAKWMYIFVKSLLRNGASVYMTDAFKLYYGSGTNASSTQKTLYPLILDKEIKLFNPDFIFILGKNDIILNNFNPIISQYGIRIINHPNYRIRWKKDQCVYYKDRLIEELNKLGKNQIITSEILS